jgi:branched-chain amino acid transport system ATP-binding protein
VLEAEGIVKRFGGLIAVSGASLVVRQGEIVALLGPNGAGKSTVLNSVSGLVPARAGRIEVGGQRVDGLPAHARVAFGLAHVLERRRLFPHLTVRQNLWLGAYQPAAKPHRAETLDAVEALFPRLRERRDQLARTLSGGEQQMVAIARGLMSRPRLLLVDEPTLGLAPLVVADILDVLRRINREQGVAVLFIEQNVELALSIAHRGYVLESGRLLLGGTADALRTSSEVRRVFLGL